MGKIFISHSSANNVEALAIHDWLSEQGWGDVFLDLDPKRGLVAGERWQAALKAAAEQCELILIMISPEWAKSRWCLAEFLLAKQMNKQILGVVVKATPIADLPVELTAEWQLVDLSAADLGWSVTISPPRYQPETTVRFSGTGLARLRSGLEKAGLDATTFIWPPAHDLGRSPYRGLLPLDEDDAGIFYGRDGAIVLTLDALRGLRANAAPRFATILGASGSGKSSFLRAGILPRLKRDSRHFYVLPIIRPERAALTGEHGFGAMLEAALKARNMTRNRADIRDAVKAGAGGVTPILRDLAVPLDAGDADTAELATLVIAVDQAEELLTADNAEAAAFLTLLAELGRRNDPDVMVIFTVRSDSFDQLQSRPELAATQPHHLIDLPPVPAGSFGDIIRGPARRVSAAGRTLHVDETLVDALLNDIEAGGTKDALPLLAFTLERLYTDYGADGDLQLGEYERLGRIRGAIEAAVEEALKRADGNAAIPKDRAARLTLLRRGLIPWLAGIDPNTGSPRRRVARLAEVPEEARPLIELMVEQRLLATDVDSATKERTIEPAHEALLRQWGALDGWLVEDSADLSTIEALRRAASEWDANARGSEFIAHRGARLTAIEQVAAGEKFASYLTSVDRAYLSAARNVEDSAVKKARAARTRLAIAASVVGVVLVAGATAGYFVWSAGEAAKTQAEANFYMAQAEAALRAGKSEFAARAALNAYELLPNTATRTAALASSMAVSAYSLGVVSPPQRVVAMSWADDATLGLLASTGSVTELAALSGELRPISAESDRGQAIGLFTPPGGGFGIVFGDGAMVKTDGTPLAPATEPPIAAYKASPSADGRVVAMKSLEGYITIRDCRGASCDEQQLDSVEFNLSDVISVKPDGNAVAVGHNPQEVWVYRDGSETPAVVPTLAQPLSVGWGMGDLLVVGTAGGGATEHHIDQPQALPESIYASGTSSAVDVAADGRYAVVCEEQSICINPLNVAPGGGLAALTGHREAIQQLRWNPSGTVVASVSRDNTLRLWSAAPDQGIAFETDTGTSGARSALAIDRARGIVAVGTRLGEIAWSDGGPYRPLPEGQANGETSGAELPKAEVSSLAFLTDGRLAVVHANEAIVVWALGKDAPDKIIRLDNLRFSRIAALNGSIRAAVPLSDRTILTLNGDDLTEARAPADTVPLDHWGLVAAAPADTAYVSYSDGSIRARNLVSGSAITVYDASQSLCGAAPTFDNNGSRSLDVSADGGWLVTTRSDAKIIAHNLTDPSRPICFELPAADSKTVAFSPDSKRLAILSATDRLYVYDLADPGNAYILGAPAVPDDSNPARSGQRTTSWLGWRDNQTLLIATAGGSGGVETVNLDPASWHARVDTLFFTP